MPEVDKTPDAVRFGPFELSVETGELRKNGVRLRLSGQPIEVLILLVKTPGKLVTREELQRHLWREDIFTDFEKGLNAAVNRLREYLGDSATDPKYIETVPGRGYRFIAKVLDRNDGVGPGKTVSHYRILEIVGRGGMGVVYKAQDLKLGRHVALKFLPEELATNHEALQRFRREASTASSLNHPNICTIYEIEEHEGQPFIVMELLQGQTLRECLISSALQRIRLEPVLDLDQLLDIALQILDGLQAAHEKGIIHRDIKPTNIFITNGRLVKILDFGLAKLIGTVNRSELETRSTTSAPIVSGLPAPLSAVGAAIGTLGYMAPEQARGEDLDARADLFSFGLVVYEMATGRSAFNGTTPAELCHAILTETPIPIHELNPSIPSVLEQVINKALNKNRELRYQGATALRTDLIDLKRSLVDRGTPGLNRLGALDIPRFTGEFIHTKQKWEALKGQIAFGRYVLNDLIGYGGTGAVFRSRDLAVGREVAFKMFYAVSHSHIGYLKDATTRSVRGLASLSHPNLQQILDYGVHLTAAADASLFVVSEFIKGKTLEEVFNSHETMHVFSGAETVVAGPRTLLHKILLARQIAAGLQAAHSVIFVGGNGFQEQCVCHGDITPRNILIEETDRAVIIDFMIPDLQRLIASEEGTAIVRDETYGWQLSDGRYIYRCPETGVYGTPGFMPPEQQAEGIVTPASDIYTLGLTLALLFFSYESLEASWPRLFERVHEHVPEQWDFSKIASKLPTSSLRDSYVDIANMLDNMTRLQPKVRLQDVQTIDRHLVRIEQQCRRAIPL